MIVLHLTGMLSWGLATEVTASYPTFVKEFFRSISIGYIGGILISANNLFWLVVITNCSHLMLSSNYIGK